MHSMVSEVAYAKKYGYMGLMPHMCALDHTYAKLMHAKLIQTHTVATDGEICDYWIVNSMMGSNGICAGSPGSETGVF